MSSFSPLWQIGAAVVLLASAFVARPATACTCPVPMMMGSSPQHGATGVPLNLQPRILVDGGVISGEMRVRCGEEDWIVDTTDRIHPEQHLVVGEVLDLPGDADCEILVNEQLVAAFSTGQEKDHTPPWAKEIDLELLPVEDSNTCGEWSQTLTFRTGVFGDDITPPDDILFKWTPRDGEGEVLWGYGDLQGWYFGEQCFDYDPTVGKNSRRTYDVQLIDVAGNAGAPMKVRVGGLPNAGCATSPYHSLAMGMFVLPFCALVLRRRRYQPSTPKTRNGRSSQPGAPPARS